MDEQLSKDLAEALRLADLVGAQMGIQASIAADLDTPTIQLGAGYIWIGAGLAYVGSPVIYIEAEAQDRLPLLSDTPYQVTSYLVYSLAYYPGSRDEPPSCEPVEIATHSYPWAAVKAAFEAYAAWQIESVLEADSERAMDEELAEAERHAAALERMHAIMDRPEPDSYTGRRSLTDGPAGDNWFLAGLMD